MNMIAPTRRNRSLFNSFMTDPFDAFFNLGAPTGSKVPPALMRTDIKESNEGFQLLIDLPGFKKEDLQVNLKDGYLNIVAETKREENESDDKGVFVRQECFSGKCSRTFYVGDDIEQEDISAKFADGVLSINVPKKQEQPKLEEGTSIAID